MKIIKLKWGFYSIIDRKGKEIAVASTPNEAKKLLKRVKYNNK